MSDKRGLSGIVDTGVIEELVGSETLDAILHQTDVGIAGSATTLVPSFETQPAVRATPGFQAEFFNFGEYNKGAMFLSDIDFSAAPVHEEVFG